MVRKYDQFCRLEDFTKPGREHSVGSWYKASRNGVNGSGLNLMLFHIVVESFGPPPHFHED